MNCVKPDFRSCRIAIIFMFILTFTLFSANVRAQSTAFTYQGRLQDNGGLANGNYDLQFTLWDAASGGTQQPQPSPVTVTRNAVAVENGIFTVQLDFTGSAFTESNRFLEIGVRSAGGGVFTILSPRQQITSTPYALRSANATSADTATNANNATNATNASQLGGVAAGQYVLTSDSRMTDARPPVAGSNNYIQNRTSQQGSSNFNISGSGTAAGTLSADAVNATTSVGIGTTPTRARLETRGAIGNTVALFGGEGAGVSLVRDYPFIGFNSYYNNGWKAISPGFGGHVGIEEDVGAMTFYVNPSVGQADSVVAPQEVMRITQDRNVQAGSTTQASTFLQAAPVGWRDSYRIFRGGNQVASIGMDSAGDLQFFTGPTSEDGTARLTISSGAIYVFPPSLRGTLVDYGGLYVGQLTSGGDQSLCTSSGYLAQCSSSRRYKDHISSFSPGLNIIQQLRPVTFNWKSNGQKDLGLVAEEVNKIDPLLTTYNSKGEIEGVKYDKLTVVLVNAIDEQQRTIESLQQQNVDAQKQNAVLRSRLDRLETAVTRLQKRWAQRHKRHSSALRS